MLKRRINRASVEEGFPHPTRAVVAQAVGPLAAWALRAEEWFILANRKCHPGKRCRARWRRRWVAAWGGGGEGSTAWMRQRLAALRLGQVDERGAERETRCFEQEEQRSGPLG